MKTYTHVFFAAIALLAGCATTPVSTAPEQLDLNRYRAVNVAPVLFAPGIAGAIPDEERALLERDLGAALKDGLPPSLRSEQPSSDVVRMEVTITELNASNPAVNVLTTALLFVPFDAGGVAFDARFYEGDSLEPFAVTSHRHISTPLELKGSFKRYGQATKALRDWSEGLARNRLP